MTTADSRRSRRIMVYGEVDGTGGSPFRASVVNLSREGVCLEHTGKLQTDQVYDLRLRIPPMMFSVRARLVWSKPHGPESGPSAKGGLHRSGAEFVGLSDDALAAISAIVPRPPVPKADAPPDA